MDSIVKTSFDFVKDFNWDKSKTDFSERVFSTKKIKDKGPRIQFNLSSSAHGDQSFYNQAKISWGNFSMKPGLYTLSKTFAGLGEARIELDSSNSISGVSILDPMDAIFIGLTMNNKDFVVLMDAQRGNNCNVKTIVYKAEGK